MNWERKALEQIILLLVKKDKELGDLYKSLYGLGIEVDINGASYEILEEITNCNFLSENIEGLHEGDYSEKEFVNFCFEFMENKFS